MAAKHSGVGDAIRRGYLEGQQALEQQRYADAAACFEQLLPLLEEAGDRLGLARIHTHLAQIAQIEDRPAEAEQAFRRALALACQVGSQSLEALVSHQLAHLLRMNAPTEARVLFTQSRAACLAVGDKRGGALALAMIGQIDFTNGAERAGIRLMLQAIDEIPLDASERPHLLEHTAYFGGKLPPGEFSAIVREQVADAAVRALFLQPKVGSDRDNPNQQ